MIKRDLSDHVLTAIGYVVRFAVYAMMIAPALIVLGASFTSGTVLEFPPRGLSIMWYQRVWETADFTSAMWTSAYLAVLATLLSLLLGFSSAFAINRFTFPGRTVFESLVLSPIVMPMVVLGLALVYLFSALGIAQSFAGLLIAHVLITLPYVVRSLLSGLLLFNRSLEEASLNLGASPVRTLLRVTLPVLTPNLMAAAIFAFVTSFGNVTLSVFLSGSTSVTLPVRIFTFVESSYDPTVAAVSGVVIILTLTIILIAERLFGMSKVLGK